MGSIQPVIKRKGEKMSKKTRNVKTFLRLLGLLIVIDIVVSIPFYLLFSEGISIVDLLIGIPIDLVMTIVTYQFCKQGNAEVPLSKLEKIFDRYGSGTREEENILLVQLRGWGKICIDDMAYDKTTGMLYAPMFIIDKIQK